MAPLQHSILACEESSIPLLLNWLFVEFRWLHEGLRITMDSPGCLPSPAPHFPNWRRRSKHLECTGVSSGQNKANRFHQQRRTGSTFGACSCNTTLHPMWGSSYSREPCPEGIPRRETPRRRAGARRRGVSLRGIPTGQGSLLRKALGAREFRGIPSYKGIPPYNFPQNAWPLLAPGLYVDWDADRYAVGEKIAEGAQGEIFKLGALYPQHAHSNEQAVLKVFKLEGWSLQDLQQQWPHGMLLKASSSTTGFYKPDRTSGIACGLMLNDGRFAFWMVRYWGDLRKVIDLRMQQNGSRAPPFSDYVEFTIIYEIAKGMRALHDGHIGIET